MASPSHGALGGWAGLGEVLPLRLEALLGCLVILELARVHVRCRKGCMADLLRAEQYLVALASFKQAGGVRLLGSGGP